MNVVSENLPLKLLSGYGSDRTLHNVPQVSSLIAAQGSLNVVRACYLYVHVPVNIKKRDAILIYTNGVFSNTQQPLALRISGVTYHKIALCTNALCTI